MQYLHPELLPRHHDPYPSTSHPVYIKYSYRLCLEYKQFSDLIAVWILYAQIRYHNRILLMTSLNKKLKHISWNCDRFPVHVICYHNQQINPVQMVFIPLINKYCIAPNIPQPIKCIHVSRHEKIWMNIKEHVFFKKIV